MDKLSTLFAICDHGIEYQTVGDDVDYAFVESGEHLYIYFKGSDSLSDWVRNFWFFSKSRKPYKDMKTSYRVHRGFLAAWKEVESIIIQKITETVPELVFDPVKNSLVNDYKWKHITVIGYSHGGSLVFFATECLWYYRSDLREEGFESYAFESPRVLKGFFVSRKLKERWKNMLVTRVNNDIVTKSPPKLFGFTHAGTLIKIKGDVSVVKDKVPRCVKAHFPQVVYDALINYEKKYNID